jgi:predicted alpha/beta hydrolase family esterase
MNFESKIDPKSVLLLPGWQNSGPDHWQSLWERAHGFFRVEEHDWMRPLRGDWIIRLEETLLKLTQPAWLVAHSLGCIQVAAWAAHSMQTHRVAGALLVAPGDPEREDLRPLLPSWSPVPRARLPFPSRVVACHNDPYCDWARVVGFARDWGSDLIDAGTTAGHLNAESGLGHWPFGLDVLHQMQAQTRFPVHAQGQKLADDTPTPLLLTPEG